MKKALLSLPMLITTCQPVTCEPELKAPLVLEYPNQYSRQADEWATIRPVDAEVMRKMAQIPIAKWVNYDPINYLNTGIGTHILVLYNIPHRDCSQQFSAGGTDRESYIRFIDTVASRITDPNTIVIIEPDALIDLRCLTPEKQQERLYLLRYALDTIPAQNYLDAGNPMMVRDHPVEETAYWLNFLGSPKFTVNVSFYDTTERSIEYGTTLSNLTGGQHFIVDTSRNGIPPVDDQFCNPPNRALGQTPTFNTGHYLVDAFLWIKTPGNSDGHCNRNEPEAGHWWPERALELARNAGW